jgi:uncharacterized membrane protein YhaH (DUF805 family)
MSAVSGSEGLGRETALSGIGASIRHNLAGLVRFGGRETRAEFWPYAIAAFLLSTLAGVVLVASAMADMLVRMQRYLLAHPEGLPPPVPGRPVALPAELIPDLSGLRLPFAIVDLLAVLLLAAAVARRLHDRDRTGLWGLLPLPFMAIGLANSDLGMAFARGERALTGLQTLQMMAGPVFWLALLALIVLLAGEGTSGSNRFGPDPARPA